MLLQTRRRHPRRGPPRRMARQHMLPRLPPPPPPPLQPATVMTFMLIARCVCVCVCVCLCGLQTLICVRVFVRRHAVGNDDAASACAHH